MRNTGLLAFGITTCVLVPTSLHFVQAGPNQVAKLYAPDATSVVIGGAKIDVSADRGMVDAGGKVHVTIAATAETRMKVPLAVLVYEAQGTGGGRVELPPRRVDREDLALDVEDGKASRTLAFTLPGFRPSYMDGSAVFGHYTVLVMSPKDANRLERARRRVTADMADLSDPQNFFGLVGERAGSDDSEPVIARVEFATRTQSDRLRIIAADTAVAGTDVPVKVRVSNPTKHALAALSVTLASEPDDPESGMPAVWAGLGSDAVQIDPLPAFALGAHETKELVFHVHPKSSGTLGLFASMQCADDHRSDPACDTGQLSETALDAMDILPAPDQDDGAPRTAQADTKPGTTP